VKVVFETLLGVNVKFSLETLLAYAAPANASSAATVSAGMAFRLLMRMY
jgi:hypothetical protein